MKFHKKCGCLRSYAIIYLFIFVEDLLRTARVFYSKSWSLDGRMPIVGGKGGGKVYMHDLGTCRVHTCVV